jgi:hypothetical protein
MNQTLPTCARCSNSFWPNGRLNPDPQGQYCDSCTPQSFGVELSAEETYEPHPAVEIIRTTPRTPPLDASRVQIQPRELPGELAPPPPGGDYSEQPNPIPNPTPAIPQTLVFNCPACMAVLNIARDLAIAGTTAPCPHCASMVIPPRIAPAAAMRPEHKSHWRPEH